ncbi:phage/plasmid primase, P4 family [Pararhodobacter aggregans]
MSAALEVAPMDCDFDDPVGTPDGPEDAFAGLTPPEPELSVPGGIVTEDSVALMFTAEHGSAARFDHDHGRWYLWDAETGHWRRDRLDAAAHWCRELARRASKGESAKVVERTQRKGFSGGVERFARADPTHAVTSEVWDPDDELLGSPGLVTNLRTGQSRKPRPGDMITRQTAVKPDPALPMVFWKAFLEEATQGDEALQAFIQVFAGYTLTGSTNEHQMLFFHGGGGNGKSLLINVLVAIMGSYAQFASMDSFASSRYERHSTDLAAMQGARLVAVSEVQQGVGWNQQRLAAMTGGDKIRARYMRQDEFEYTPKFKLWVAGNYQPELGNVSDAMRRRMNIIPFNHKPRNPDPDLFEKLKAEWPAILHWAILGAVEWYREGLTRPGVVVEETNAYFEGQDTFGQWLGECCRIDRANRFCWDTAKDLFASWVTFSKAMHAEPGSEKGLAELLKASGFVGDRERVNGVRVRVWRGLQVIRNDGDGGATA